MASYYIKARARAKMERFAHCFFVIACLVGLCAAIFAAGYTLGNYNATNAVQQCENAGASGYIIESGAISCLYE